MRITDDVFINASFLCSYCFLLLSDKSIKYKKYRSAIVYSMVESYYVIPSPIKK